ncbi:MAG: type II toxin-antitoxin system VapC family toxin [Thaumarchaeota archaeon]|jgi:predicted nucleic acid-binding protein|nr:type II toxin-antitoxin system VapC family toxin [Nitrososphaerota archaeon]
MKRELEGSLVFDSSSILELLYSTSNGVKLKEALKAEKVEGNISEITVAEISYILCRKLGIEEARTRVKNLLDSGYITVHETFKLIEYASNYKCKRNLSLADCFSLALAKKLTVPVLFARREKELLEEISSGPFDVEILFLEDFTK